MPQESALSLAKAMITTLGLAHVSQLPHFSLPRIAEYPIFIAAAQYRLALPAGQHEQTSSPILIRAPYQNFSVAAFASPRLKHAYRSPHLASAALYIHFIPLPYPFIAHALILGVYLLRIAHLAPAEQIVYTRIENVRYPIQRPRIRYIHSPFIRAVALPLYPKQLRHFLLCLSSLYAHIFQYLPFHTAFLFLFFLFIPDSDHNTAPCFIICISGASLLLSIL